MRSSDCDMCGYIKELITFKIIKHPPRRIRYMDVKKIIKKYNITWGPLFKDIIIGNVYIDYDLLNIFFHAIYSYDLLMKQNKLIKVKKNDFDNYYKSYHFDLFVLYYVFFKKRYLYAHGYNLIYNITFNRFNTFNYLYYFYAIRYGHKHKYILL